MKAQRNVTLGKCDKSIVTCGVHVCQAGTGATYHAPIKVTKGWLRNKPMPMTTCYVLPRLVCSALCPSNSECERRRENEREREKRADMRVSGEIEDK